MKREAVEPTTRLSMTPARRRRCLERFNHQCGRLDCSEVLGLEIDHNIALALGGKEVDENLIPLCPAHHKIKTRNDIRMIYKAKRIIKKNDPYQRKPSRLQSRGFDKTRKRTFSGKVEMRK